MNDKKLEEVREKSFLAGAEQMRDRSAEAMVDLARRFGERFKSKNAEKAAGLVLKEAMEVILALPLRKEGP